MGAAAPAPTNGVAANPEVVAKPARRRYTAEYKLRILREAERCLKSGEIGALLRREGLYSSLLTTWRRQQEQGSLRALAAQKRGRKPEKADPIVRRVAQLERENRRLQERLKQAEMIIDFQKKVSEILGIPLKDPESEGNV
jgi:transposase-like protein